MSDKRHMTVVEGNKEHGLFVGRSPYSIAKKVVSKLSNGKKVVFSLREITQGSKKKVYGPYEGIKKKLKEAVKVGDRVYKYESVVKKVEKGGGGRFMTDSIVLKINMLSPAAQKLKANINEINGYTNDTVVDNKLFNSKKQSFNEMKRIISNKSGIVEGEFKLFEKGGNYKLTSNDEKTVIIPEQPLDNFFKILFETFPFAYRQIHAQLKDKSDWYNLASKISTKYLNVRENIESTFNVNLQKEVSPYIKNKMSDSIKPRVIKEGQKIGRDKFKQLCKNQAKYIMKYIKQLFIQFFIEPVGGDISYIDAEKTLLLTNDFLASLDTTSIYNFSSYLELNETTVNNRNIASRKFYLLTAEIAKPNRYKIITFDNWDACKTQIIEKSNFILNEYKRLKNNLLSAMREIEVSGKNYNIVLGLDINDLPLIYKVYKQKQWNIYPYYIMKLYYSKN